jgi:peptide deformylase
MIYPIVKYGQDVLEKPAAGVKEFGAPLEKLVEDMFETMYAANGVGLAAPQIGLSLRLCVIDVSSGQDPKARLVLVNPAIMSRDGEQLEEEGCLSLPDFRAKTARPAVTVARGLDIKGQPVEIKGEGLLARALSHEIDHLDGKLFICHLSRLKRDSILRRVRRMIKAGEW